jgi:hypothetical protein
MDSYVEKSDVKSFDRSSFSKFFQKLTLEQGSLIHGYACEKIGERMKDVWTRVHVATTFGHVNLGLYSTVVPIVD